MADFRVRRAKPSQTKIRNVPIVVTPEGFWCCPSPVVFQKTIKNQSFQNKQKASPPSPLKAPDHKTQNTPGEKKPASMRSRSRVLSEDQKCVASDNSMAGPERTGKASGEAQQRKISVGFGQPETSNLKVVLSGKGGISVRMSVHRNILVEQSSFFKDKLTTGSPLSCVEIGDCEDVEIYVETVGLMYCKEVKRRLIKQSVPRVLRVLKVCSYVIYFGCYWYI